LKNQSDNDLFYLDVNYHFVSYGSQYHAMGGFRLSSIVSCHIEGLGFLSLSVSIMQNGGIEKVTESSLAAGIPYFSG